MIRGQWAEEESVVFTASSLAQTTCDILGIWREMLLMPGLLNGQLRHFNNGSASFTPRHITNTWRISGTIVFHLTNGLYFTKEGNNRRLSFKIIEERILINAAEIYFIGSHITRLMFLFWALSDGGKIVMDVTLV